MSIHMNKNNRHHYLDNIDYRCSRRSLLYQSLRHDLVQTWAICLMQTSLSFNAFCAIWTQRQLPILFDPMMPNAPSSHYLREVALQVSLDLLDTLHDVERETVLKDSLVTSISRTIQNHPVAEDPLPLFNTALLYRLQVITKAILLVYSLHVLRYSGRGPGSAEREREGYNDDEEDIDRPKAPIRVTDLQLSALDALMRVMRDIGGDTVSDCLKIWGYLRGERDTEKDSEGEREGESVLHWRERECAFVRIHHEKWSSRYDELHPKTPPITLSVSLTPTELDNPNERETSDIGYTVRKWLSAIFPDNPITTDTPRPSKPVKSSKPMSTSNSDELHVKEEEGDRDGDKRRVIGAPRGQIMLAKRTQQQERVRQRRERLLHKVFAKDEEREKRLKEERERIREKLMEAEKLLVLVREREKRRRENREKKEREEDEKRERRKSIRLQEKEKERELREREKERVREEKRLMRERGREKGRENSGKGRGKQTYRGDSGRESEGERVWVDEREGEREGEYESASEYLPEEDDSERERRRERGRGSGKGKRVTAMTYRMRDSERDSERERERDSVKRVREGRRRRTVSRTDVRSSDKAEREGETEGEIMSSTYEELLRSIELSIRDLQRDGEGEREREIVRRGTSNTTIGKKRGTSSNRRGTSSSKRSRGSAATGNTVVVEGESSDSEREIVLTTNTNTNNKRVRETQFDDNSASDDDNAWTHKVIDVDALQAELRRVTEEVERWERGLGLDEEREGEVEGERDDDEEEGVRVEREENYEEMDVLDIETQLAVVIAEEEKGRDNVVGSHSRSKGMSSSTNVDSYVDDDVLANLERELQEYVS